jgi:hypothetical protein
MELMPQLRGKNSASDTFGRIFELYGENERSDTDASPTDAPNVCVKVTTDVARDNRDSSCENSA